MRHAHTVEQVRAAEAALMATLPDGVLMGRAAFGLATGILDLLPSAYGVRVLLLVGAGNNGGDALFAGAHLARRGVAVRALPFSDTVHEGGREALRAAGGRLVDVDEAVRFAPDVLVDGLVGIGGQPGLRPVAQEALERLTEREQGGRPLVVAVDLPSGLGVDTGTTPAPHVRADVTFTFGTHKVATLAGPAAAAGGDVRLVDIGLGPWLDAPVLEALDADDVRALLPLPSYDDHKYTRGVVGVRAGSATYPGAAVLCVSGAATGLVGMVRYVGPDAVAAAVRKAFPEVVGTGRVQAWAVGSGADDQAAEALRAALADAEKSEDVTVVVDADALAHVPVHLPGPRGHRVVLTPHAGELAGLLAVERAEIEAEPLAHARLAAGRYGATVLLKGPRTVVASPGRTPRVNTTGTPWLATAGAGDVLCGLIACLAAAGLEPHDAASVGAWIHGRAGERAAQAGPVVAGDLTHAIRGVLLELSTGVGESTT